MTSVRSVIVLSVLAVSAVLVTFALAPHVVAQRTGAATTANWSLHNLDLAARRYSTMDQINPSNVKTLTPRWLFQYGIIDGISNHTTPVLPELGREASNSCADLY